MSVTNSVLIPQPANVIAMKGGHGHQLRRRSLLYYSSSKFVRSVKERSYIIISFPRSGATIPQQICKYCTAPAELWTLGAHCELWYKPLVVMAFLSGKQSLPSHPLFLFSLTSWNPISPSSFPWNCHDKEIKKNQSRIVIQVALPCHLTPPPLALVIQVALPNNL